ncbi:hypothetical protein [Dactylosporangium sp. NPDC051541]|uniref:hypothetical protein n=1 Tax=Dactylosporangium sp. NPDC051541 TaxID=3363977 RepID=UPI0037BBD1C3
MIQHCPECGEPGKMIIYGLPDPQLRQGAAEGRVSLGGCLIEDGAPDWHCPRGHRWADPDLDGRSRLLDSMLAEYGAPAPRPAVHDGDRVAVRGGASTVEWRAGTSALTLVTPGAPDEVAPFPGPPEAGGHEFVVSPDERHLVLFSWSGQGTLGLEVFRLQPAFAHIGGLGPTHAHGGSPVFSPDGRWLALFTDGEYTVRGTGEDFEERYDANSDAHAVLDWACLHLLRLPELTTYRVDVGVDLPVATNPDVYSAWEPYDVVQRVTDHLVVLRMPWGPEVAVPLPRDTVDNAVTTLGPAVTTLGPAVTTLGPAATGEVASPPPLAVRVRRDGETLTVDGTGQVWGTVLVLAVTGEVTALAVTAGPPRLLAGGTDGGLRLWDLTTGTPAGEQPDGRHDRFAAIVAATMPGLGPVLGTAGIAGSLGLHNAVTGRAVRAPVTARTAGFTAMAAVTMPDGRVLLATAAANGMIRLRDPITGDPVGAELNRAGAGVRSMTVLPRPDGRHLIATADGPFRRWDLTRGGQVRLWDPALAQSATGVPGAPSDARLAEAGQTDVVAVHSLVLDGRTLLVTAGGDGAVALWDPADGALVGDPLPPHAGPGAVTALTAASGPGGRTVLVTASRTLRCLFVWDPATGALWQLDLGVAVHALAADGVHIAAAHEGGLLAITVADAT